jgi:hypothetical protein
MTRASWRISSFLAFFLTLGAVQTHAATVTPSEVTNLQVGAEFYDVKFLAGSCVLAFDGCNDLEDIAFPGSGALSESMIALSAVLNTGFSFPAFRPNGCSDENDSCLILTPSSLDRIGSIFIPDIRLTWDSLNNRWFYGSGAFIPSLEYNRISFAVWSPSAPISPVPLPAGGLLLSSGLLGLWALRRQKHKNI